ncbi:cyd operon protein YbgE [Edaphovirga cremea]|jgi:cyd operon protein YbgE|uniref:cyd operon protein YbgE n=1 Tax=Edaphovirga cremea TaxID=2267246 RepID=UPI000DF013E9|nr:cyd operon protein YbgE [Edaphovirga cremea]
MSALSDKLYDVVDKGPLRALSLVMALVLTGCIFWDPTPFASRTSQLETWQGLLMIWAVCSGIIHGFGFRPKRAIWRAFFAPLPAMVILAAMLIYFIA